MVKHATAAACILVAAVLVCAAGDAIDIGARLELFVDGQLVETLSGGARLVLHRPTPREVVFKTDAPWEGNASGFQSVFRDGSVYRMYYRGGHYANGGPETRTVKAHPWFLCRAESDDGVHWRRPELGLFEFNGSRANNIVLAPESVSEFGGGPAESAVFKDTNPDCPPDEKYKIVIVGTKPRGLYLLKSADGVHFALMSRKPFMTTGDFDSQNLMFWDPVRREYREYHRAGRAGLRDIMTSAAASLNSFPEPRFLEYPGAPKEGLYTNQVQPYFRAPHIFMGFPMRYRERSWVDALFELPGREARLARGEAHPRYGAAITDALFMASRDGATFKRWAEAFIRPGPQQRRSWVYGDNFVVWGMLETKSIFEDAPAEISLLATEGYWEDSFTSLRRYSLRVDGFVSAAAPLSGGEIVTKPVMFEGGNLALNFETSGGGSVRVEIQDASGKPVDGYALTDCSEIFGDSLRHIVRWKGRGGDVRPLAGKPVRLRFALSDGDLYSFQFVPYEPDPRRPDISQFGVPKLPAKSAGRGPFVALDEDFRSAEAGTSPTKGDLNPRSKAWTILEGEADRVQILNDDSVGSGKAGSRRYLKVERRDEVQLAGGIAYVRLDPADAAETENGVVELEARILVPSSNKGCVAIDGFDNVPPWGCDRPCFQLRLFPDGSASYYRTGSVRIPGLRIPTDAWQDVSLRARMKEAVFDVTVAGKTFEGIPFASGDRHRLIAISLGPIAHGVEDHQDSNHSTLYVERVRVKVTP